MTELGRRFWYRQGWKLAGVVTFMWLFFTAYFHLLRNPASAVTTMPLTLLDHLVPFQPAALAVYVSLWFYVGIPPGMTGRLRDALVHGAWTAALCVAGLACFYFWPTAVPARPMDIAGYPAFVLLKGVDAAGNACPSLHVATALFSAVAIHRMLREVDAPGALRWGNGLWFAAICWSTMAVRQHVALDVAGGLALGTLFAIARWPPVGRRA